MYQNISLGHNSTDGHFKFDIDQNISQGLFYITALAIMQDFRDNEKKQLKMTASWPFYILFFL